MMTFVLSRLQSGTKTKLKQTTKTEDKYFTTLRWLINAYVMSNLFSRLRKFSVPFNFVFFFSDNDAFETKENIHHTGKFQTKQI